MARLNFADVENQKEFDVLPAGRYPAQITGLTERQASEQSDNAGARLLRWEFTIPEDHEYGNRKVWDNQICIPDAMWKIKGMIGSAGFDTSTIEYDDEDQLFYYTDDDNEEQVLDMEDFVGSTVDLKVGIRPARTVNGKEYSRQNRVNHFYPHEVSDSELLG